LKKNDIYSRYYAINEIYRKNSNDYIVIILKGDFFFIYNESHIWGIRRLNNKWYTVNSIGGVSNLNINSVLSQKNIGFIIPVDISKEFYRNLKLIKITLGDKSNIKSISEYLVNQNKNKFILGDLEIPLGICMNILETHYDNKKNCSIDFFPIKKETLEYNKFLSLFTNGRYNDIKLINEYLPSILNKLSNLSIKPI
jgi:hypothetical protein